MKKQLLIAGLALLSLNSFAQWSNNPLESTPLSELYDLANCRLDFGSRSVTDGAGGVITTFVSTTYASTPFKTEIRAQRLTATGIKLWGENGVKLCDSSENSYSRKFITDGKGGAFFFWETLKIGKNKIYIQKIDGNGTLLWGSNGKEITTNTVNVRIGGIIADALGGVVFSFIDNTNNTVKAQRLSATGLPLWASGGIKLNDSDFINSSRLHASDIFTDGTGFSFIFDTESESFNIYMQNLNANGTKKNPTNTHLYNNLDEVTAKNTVLESDANGGIYFSIIEHNGINTKLYLQHFLANGTKTYAGLGIVVDESVGRIIDNELYLDTHIAADNSGGVVVSWSDVRNGNNGLYAQRFNSVGTKLWNANDVTIIPTLFEERNGTEVKVNQNGDFVFFIKKWDNTLFTNSFYVQKINALGIRQYAPEGITIADPTSSKNREHLVVSNNTIILVWDESYTIKWSDESTSTENDIFAQAVLENVTLPVSFTNFTAEFKNQKTNLKWVTASESNNKHFSIERSQDGLTFSSIGIVNGAGTTSETKYYNFYDIDAFTKSGVLYYRIKQVDFDGNSDFTEIKAVNVGSLSSSNQINCYPNPVTNGELNIAAGNEAIKSITLINLSGVKVISLPKVSNPKAVVVNTSGLTKGVYLLEITNAKSTMVRKVIIY